MMRLARLLPPSLGLLGCAALAAALAAAEPKVTIRTDGDHRLIEAVEMVQTRPSL